ncbi:MAG TPA: phosphoribosylanthranilate isomerase [Thermoleophilia bacterium]|nr:phosphoribosylanthranilate isomerase [Thermoleophilia bacterium]
MAGVTRVKVCGLTRAEDVRAAADLGAWALGFVLTESPRRVDVARAGQLTKVARDAGASAARTPARDASSAHVPPLTVGVVTTESPAWIAAALEASRLDAVQLSAGADGPAVAEVLAAARREPRPLVIAAADTPDASLADFTLLDARAPGAYGGTGLTLDWRALDDELGTPRERLVLAGGLTPANAADAVRALRPAAVDVSSGVESVPGVKDAELLHAFFAAVEHADKDAAEPATATRRTSA